MSTKVLKCNYNVIENVEGYTNQIQAIRKHLEEMHLAMGAGKSYVAVIDRGEGNIRLLVGKDVATLTKFVQDTEESDGPFISVNIINMETLQ